MLSPDQGSRYTSNKYTLIIKDPPNWKVDAMQKGSIFSCHLCIISILLSEYMHELAGFWDRTCLPGSTEHATFKDTFKKYYLTMIMF